MIRDSFALMNGRAFTRELSGDRAILARQVDSILDRVESGASGVEHDGPNHLISDRVCGDTIRHDEAWFTPALPLSVAEYPEEAKDRTYLVSYQIQLDPEHGTVAVAKETKKAYGKAEFEGWNIA